MKIIGTIFVKEAKTYLRSPWFFMIVALACTIASTIFLIQVGLFQARSIGFMKGEQGVPTLHEAVISNYIGTIHFFLFLFLPALTARLIAEEKKLKSFDLLMTAPVTSTQIVMAKILAGLWVLVFILAVTGLYPLYLSLFTNLEWGLFFSTYLAIFLVGACYVTIGVFTSSITDSMIVATVLAVVLNLGLWLLALLGQNTDDAMIQSIVNHISINYHFSNMIRGRVEVAGLVYLLSIIGFFGFLAQRAVEAMRWR
jgi:gliding motility-associated transport system permease protein